MFRGFDYTAPPWYCSVLAMPPFSFFASAYDARCSPNYGSVIPGSSVPPPGTPIIPGSSTDPTPGADPGAVGEAVDQLMVAALIAGAIGLVLLWRGNRR